MSHRITRRHLIGAVAVASVLPALARTAAFDPERFVADVRAANLDADPQQAVEAVLTRTLANPGAIVAAFGSPARAGPTALYAAPELTILNIVWPPGMILPPHNHLMWATIGIYTGREDNIVWERTTEGSVTPSRAASVGTGEVFSLPEDAIHSVVNPVSRYTAAIHIYGGDFYATQRSEWDPETLTEHPQDFDAVQRRFEDTRRRHESTR